MNTAPMPTVPSTTAPSTFALTRRSALAGALLAAGLLASGCQKAKKPASKTISKPAPSSTSPSGKIAAEAAAKLAQGQEAVAAGAAMASSAAAAEAAAETAEQAKKKAQQRAVAEAAARAKLERGEAMPAGAAQDPNVPLGDIAREVIRHGNVPSGGGGDVAPKWLVKRIKNVAANHDKAGLQRWCTPRMVVEMNTMLPKHGERFWRHLDRYASAAAAGYEVSEQRAEGADKLHLTVKAAGDIVLKPVLVRTAQGWRFDRF